MYAGSSHVPREKPFWAGELKQGDFYICISAMTSLDGEERVQTPATHHMMRVGGSELKCGLVQGRPLFLQAWAHGLAIPKWNTCLVS